MNETSREKRVAATTVKPNWRKNCPTCPDMSATAVKTTIKRLRSKLGDPPLIDTVREGGYRIGGS